MGPLAGGHAQHAVGGGDGVAAALDGELDDLVGVEVVGVGGEGRARGVLDALVDGEDRDVAGAAQAAGVEDALPVVQHGLVAVGARDDAVDEVRPGQVEAVLADGGFVVAEQGFGVGAEDFFDIDGGVGHGVSRSRGRSKSCGRG